MFFSPKMELRELCGGVVGYCIADVAALLILIVLRRRLVRFRDEQERFAFEKEIKQEDNNKRTRGDNGEQESVGARAWGV